MIRLAHRLPPVAALYAGGGGGGGGAGTTWSPSDKPSQIDTLANANLTVSKSADSGNWRSIRTADPIQGGDKFYFELNMDAIAMGNGFLIGFATAAAAILNTYTGSTAGSIGWQTNFSTPYGGWTVGGATIPATSAGDRLGFAVDKANAKWWSREVTGGSVGQWNENNASHDPATNTGGHTITDSTLLAASDWYLALSILVPGNQVTLVPNGGFLGAAPSGFTGYTT